MMLRCVNVSCAVSGKAVLRGVNLEVKPGTLTAVVGPCGSGKSTLLAIMAGRLDTCEGTVEREGRVGRVHQFPEQQLFAATAFEDVLFGPLHNGLSAEDAERRAEEALEAVGIGRSQARTRSPLCFSGGEQRRIAIAGILALAPDFILFDEPTVGLDPQERRRCWDLMKGLAAQGCGVVVATHDLPAVSSTADEVLLLSDGRAAKVEPGSVEKAMANAHLAKRQEGAALVGTAPSPLSHRKALDPRAAIGAFLLLLTASVLAEGAIAWAALAVAALASAFFCRMGCKGLGKAVAPFAPMLAGIAFYDALVVSGGQLLFSWGPFSVTTHGLLFSAETVLKFCCALVFAACLMRSCGPGALCDGFRLLGNPLRRLGAPVDDAALALTVTFRFIPVLSQEVERVMEAQRERGAVFDKGGIAQRLRSLAPVIAPVAAGAFRHASILAAAMENRSFSPGQKRACYRQYRMGPRDWAVLTFSVAVLVMVAVACV